MRDAMEEMAGNQPAALRDSSMQVEENHISEDVGRWTCSKAAEVDQKRTRQKKGREEEIHLCKKRVVEVEITGKVSSR